MMKKSLFTVQSCSTILLFSSCLQSFTFMGHGHLKSNKIVLKTQGPIKLQLRTLRWILMSIYADVFMSIKLPIEHSRTFLKSFWKLHLLFLYFHPKWSWNTVSHMTCCWCLIGCLQYLEYDLYKLIYAALNHNFSLWSNIIKK